MLCGSQHKLAVLFPRPPPLGLIVFKIFDDIVECSGDIVCFCMWCWFSWVYHWKFKPWRYFWSQNLAPSQPTLHRVFTDKAFMDLCRGEKAFCSAECRDKQIRSEDYKEKFASGALKPLDYSVSPCSGPLMFFAGVVAA